MNSGGKDSVLVLSQFLNENSEAEILAVLLETDNQYSENVAKTYADKKQIPLDRLPYRETRRAISGSHAACTIFWGFEFHIRGVQNALQKDCDVLLTGATNVHLNVLPDLSSTKVEELLEEMQELLEVKTKVDVRRPIRHLIYRDMNKINYYKNLEV